MQTDAQARILARQGDRFVGGGFIDHEAGRGQDALAMGANDRLVDGMGTAEIVRVDDQAASGFTGCHSWAWPRPGPGGTRCGK